MLNPSEILNSVSLIGKEKASKETYKQFLSSFLAGAYIAFGGLASLVAAHAIENPGLSKLVIAAIFPVGLILILICGGELFTGNTLITVSYLDKRTSLRPFIKNLMMVYFGNFVGTLFISFMIFKGTDLPYFNNELLSYKLIGLIHHKMSLPFAKAFASGILCNILVCLAVWGSYSTKEPLGKILIVWFPIMTFVLSGYEHSIANMFYFSSGLFLKTVPLAHISTDLMNKLEFINITLALKNLVAVTMGNLISGVFFVSGTYWCIFRKKNEELNL